MKNFLRAYKLTDKAFKDVTELSRHNPKIRKKIFRLINEVREHGYDLPQTGKPEPLRGNLSGWWSKRIDDTNRLIYRVSSEMKDGEKVEFVEIASCKDHYE